MTFISCLFIIARIFIPLDSSISCSHSAIFINKAPVGLSKNLCNAAGADEEQQKHNIDELGVYTVLRSITPLDGTIWLYLQPKSMLSISCKLPAQHRNVSW